MIQLPLPAAIVLVIALMMFYAHQQAQSSAGPPPGFHVASFVWGPGSGTMPRDDNLNVVLTNGEKHLVRPLSVELLAAPGFDRKNLSFHGQIQAIATNTGHISPGQWLLWSGGATYRFHSVWELTPDMGLGLIGSIDSSVPRHRANTMAARLPLAGIRLRYLERNRLYVRTIDLSEKGMRP
jgi:hypothetical protein